MVQLKPPSLQILPSVLNVPNICWTYKNESNAGSARISQKSSSNSSPVQKRCSQEMLLGLGLALWLTGLIVGGPVAASRVPVPAHSNWPWGSLTNAPFPWEQLMLGSMLPGGSKASCSVLILDFLNLKPLFGGRALCACSEYLVAVLTAVVLCCPNVPLPSCGDKVTLAAFSLWSEHERNFSHFEGLVQAVGGCVFSCGTTAWQTAGTVLSAETASPSPWSGTVIEHFLCCNKKELS